ncbi:MAG: redoxin domain-containing protein [Spirochaetes bacterium]|nr:redoxin domain-containing protein [Spirochaetota bacterium]
MSDGDPIGDSGGAQVGRGPLARELLRLRCLQLDTAPLEELIAYDRAATAAAEARLQTPAAAVGDPAPPLPAQRFTAAPEVPHEAVPPAPPPPRLLLTWYLSRRSPFCRAALLALAAEFRRSDASTAVIALTPEPPETARRTSADLALPFPVVHDNGSTAEEFGVRYAAPLEFAGVLGLTTAGPSSGSSGTQPPGSDELPLPLPATFLVEGGRISARFVHPDSRYRAEPAEFLRT